jgi:hypothetical protein
MGGYLERVRQVMGVKGAEDSAIKSGARVDYEKNELNEKSPLEWYREFPCAQVEAAEAINDKFGITDPVLRRYNVLVWVRGYYQDRCENHGEFYHAIVEEQLRLGRMLVAREKDL